MAALVLAAGPTRSVVYHSPVGPLKLVATEDGILAVKFLFGKHEDKVHVALPAKREFTENGRLDGDESEAESHLKVCNAWLDAYFEGTLLKSDPPPPPRPKLALPATGIYSKPSLTCETIVRWGIYILHIVHVTYTQGVFSTPSGTPY